MVIILIIIITIRYICKLSVFILYYYCEIRQKSKGSPYYECSSLFTRSILVKYVVNIFKTVFLCFRNFFNTLFFKLHR